ncbi:hypothetical protein UFOVP516_34 [uncultured Caudovirales phage]|uniref:Uncharacterized protein n=1 Tax=uncultured Caudovirales phage TaxID=2100421 RepID=A0A6J5MPG3_9CAUD|nr:hypothetical protein UFOVP516_34 [uncultured Caudovirales phage]
MKKNTKKQLNLKKQHLINMMKADEDLGLYGEPKQETLEEEILSKIKFVLLVNNDAQAIRFLEQYAEFQKERLCDSEVIQRIRASKSDAEARRIIKTI